MLDLRNLAHLFSCIFVYIFYEDPEYLIIELSTCVSVSAVVRRRRFRFVVHLAVFDPTARLGRVLWLHRAARHEQLFDGGEAFGRFGEVGGLRELPALVPAEHVEVVELADARGVPTAGCGIKEQ